MTRTLLVALVVFSCSACTGFKLSLNGVLPGGGNRSTSDSAGASSAPGSARAPNACAKYAGQTIAAPATWADDRKKLGSLASDLSHLDSYYADPYHQAQLDSIPAARVLAKELPARYEGYWCATRLDSRGEVPGQMEETYQQLVYSLAQLDKVLTEARGSCAAKFDQALPPVRAAITAAKGNLKDLNDREEAVQKALKEATRQYKVVRAAFGAQAPEAKSREALLTALEQEIIDAARLPTDVYAKADKASLKKAFAKEAEGSGKKVLAVVLLREDWNRQSGSAWQGDQLVNYDQGFMAGYVVVPEDAQTAQVLHYNPRKDFLDGAKVKFDVYVPYEVGKIRLKAVASATPR